MSKLSIPSLFQHDQLQPPNNQQDRASYMECLYILVQIFCKRNYKDLGYNRRRSRAAHILAQIPTGYLPWRKLETQILVISFRRLD